MFSGIPTCKNSSRLPRPHGRSKIDLIYQSRSIAFLSSFRINESFKYLPISDRSETPALLSSE